MSLHPNSAEAARPTASPAPRGAAPVPPATAPLPESAALARPFASFAMRAEVRLFYTSRDLACAEDPDLFFNPHKKQTAIAFCGGCPFRGRCGYNAVAMGATHGIWGGVMLP